MIRARQGRLKDKQKEIVVCTASDQPVTTRENIVSAQYGFMTIREIIQEANVAILKLHSILVSRAPKVFTQLHMLLVWQLKVEHLSIFYSSKQGMAC